MIVISDEFLINKDYKTRSEYTNLSMTFGRQYQIDAYEDNITFAKHSYLDRSVLIDE